MKQRGIENSAGTVGPGGFHDRHFAVSSYCQDTLGSSLIGLPGFLGFHGVSSWKNNPICSSGN